MNTALNTQTSDGQLYSSMPLTKALGKLALERRRFLPVWDGAWLVGLCTTARCRRYIAIHRFYDRGATVGDIMSPNLIFRVTDRVIDGVMRRLRASDPVDFVVLNHDEELLRALSCGPDAGQRTFQDLALASPVLSGRR